MMRRRLLIVVAAGILLMSAAATGAVALTGASQPQPATTIPPFNVTNVSPTSGPPGTVISFSGVGCPGNPGQVDTFFSAPNTAFPHLVDGLAQGDASGAWSATIQVPANSPPATGYSVGGQCVASSTGSSGPVEANFEVTAGSTPLFAITSATPTSGPGGTFVTLQMTGCPGPLASVGVAFLGAPVEVEWTSAQAVRNPDTTWSASLEVPGFLDPQTYPVRATCANPNVGDTSFATVMFTLTGPPTTTTLPTTPLSEVNPTSGPAGTVVTVHGSNCMSDLGGVRIILSADDDPSTTLALDFVDKPALTGGDWTGSITVPGGLDPNRAYSIDAQCWGDGFNQHHPGEQVEYFGYVKQPFTLTAPSDTSSTLATPTTVASVPPTHTPRSGYWMLGLDGRVYPFGAAHNFGNADSPSVAIATRRDGRGYWVTDSAGNVSGFGAARTHGGRPQLHLGERVSAISATPSGNGYWLFTNFGRAFAYGDAHSQGDMSGKLLNGPIVASIATPTGRGYYMVGSDGGVFSFGDARFHGSTGGMRLNRPVVGISPTPNGSGYWLVADDGGVFAFDAPFRGSMGAVHLNRPVNGLVAYGNGYVMAASDGGVFDFSDRPFVGSLANNPPTAPIVGVAAFTS